MDRRIRITIDRKVATGHKEVLPDGRERAVVDRWWEPEPSSHLVTAQELAELRNAYPKLGIKRIPGGVSDGDAS